MKKSMTRSDLASEAVRRPKQPQKNLLEKIRMVSQSSVNEFQEVISILFCQRVSGGYLNLLSLSLKAKYPKETAPPMAAAGLLGPDLVILGFPRTKVSYKFARRKKSNEISFAHQCTFFPDRRKAF